MDGLTYPTLKLFKIKNSRMLVCSFSFWLFKSTVLLSSLAATMLVAATVWASWMGNRFGVNTKAKLVADILLWLELLATVARWWRRKDRHAR